MPGSPRVPRCARPCRPAFHRAQRRAENWHDPRHRNRIVGRNQRAHRTGGASSRLHAPGGLVVHALQPVREPCLRGRQKRHGRERDRRKRSPRTGCIDPVDMIVPRSDDHDRPDRTSRSKHRRRQNGDNTVRSCARCRPLQRRWCSSRYGSAPGGVENANRDQAQGFRTVATRPSTRVVRSSLTRRTESRMLPGANVGGTR